MSICSDVFITKEEAKKLVKEKLMEEQEKLIDLAIKAMDNYDLTSHLHSEFYFYHIEEE